MDNINNLPSPSRNLNPRTLFNSTTRQSPELDDVAATLQSLRRSPSPAPSPMLSVDQFQQLLSMITDTIKTQHTTTQAKDINPLALARLEHYISQGLSFKFDGDQEKLIPWVKKFVQCGLVPCGAKPHTL
jgi:hypothetical protein